MMTASISSFAAIHAFLEQYDGLLNRSAVGQDCPCGNVSIDSRTLLPGDLFIALRGENFDGHQFVVESLQKSAAAAVVDAEWYQTAGNTAGLSGQPLIVVQNTLDFLQQWAAWHRRRFSVPVIGLTGSNGKTTTREMIFNVLSTRFRVLQSEGNQNNHIGLPLTMLRMNDQTEIAVLEMGSNHPGEIAALAELAAPTHGLVTNIGHGHIGYFGGLPQVRSEKISLLEHLAEPAIIFLNCDDPLLRDYRPEGRKIVTVGTASGCRVCGRLEGFDPLGCVRFRLNDQTSIQLRIPGAQQLSNALLAAAVGLQFGVSPAEIRAALEKMPPAEQRMECFSEAGIIYINDAYNANPDSMRAAIDHLCRLNLGKGRRIALLADMLELGEFAEEEHRSLGEYIAGKPVDYCYLYGPLSRFILEGIKAHRQHTVQAKHFSDHQEMAADIGRKILPGDALLFKGSRGMRMEKVLNHLVKGRSNH